MLPSTIRSFGAKNYRCVTETLRLVCRSSVTVMEKGGLRHVNFRDNYVNFRDIRRKFCRRAWRYARSRLFSDNVNNEEEVASQPFKTGTRAICFHPPVFLLVPCCAIDLKYKNVKKKYKFLQSLLTYWWTFCISSFLQKINTKPDNGVCNFHKMVQFRPSSLNTF